MSSAKLIGATVRCAAALLSVAAARCGHPTASGPASAASGDAPAVVEVSTARVRRGEITQPLSAPGSVVARRESQIGAEVPGRIERVFVAEGERVEAGAPLFQIDPISYEMAQRTAEAGLDVAAAQRAQLEAELARLRTLRGQNIVAQQDFDRLTTKLAVARAQERQAQEALALARHNLERTTVRAPYAGSIAHRLADEGTTALVQPQTIVVVLQETGELEARAAIPESQLALVQAGDHALLHVEGIAAAIATTVSAVNDSIDPATRTYLVKMRVPNADYALKAGIFASVEILPRAKSDALILPSAAVRTEDGRARVLLVRDGTAVAVPVELGLTTEQAVEVLAGLGEGDEVVVGAGARAIAPGMRVRVTAAPEAPTT